MGLDLDPVNMAFVVPVPPRSFASSNRVQLRPRHWNQHITHRETSGRRSLAVMKLNVLVTGASGKTGSSVFGLLRDAADKFSVTGLVRSKEKAAGIPELQGGEIIEGDITVPETIVPAMEGKDALVVVTAAVPRFEPREEGPPKVYFEAGGTPEDIDWNGSRTQIDLAKSLKLKHIVFVGSMGSTNDNHPLNKMGNGNILKFKRKAENYLIDSGVPYTIINPAGLLDDPPFEHELIVGHADKIFEVYPAGECGIPRRDVARVIFSALLDPSGKNKAFDLAAKPLGRGEPTKDPSSIFEAAGAAL